MKTTFQEKVYLDYNIRFNELIIRNTVVQGCTSFKQCP